MPFFFKKRKKKEKKKVEKIKQTTPIWLEWEWLATPTAYGVAELSPRGQMVVAETTPIWPRETPLFIFYF
jgi:hypothetical protein